MQTPSDAPAAAFRPPDVDPLWRHHGTVRTPTVAAPVADDAGSGLPFFLFCVYTLVLIARPQDFLPALTALQPALVLTLTTVAATFLFHAPGKEGVLRLRETKLYVFFYLAMLAGVPFSLYPRVSLEFILFVYIVNVVFFLLFVTHVNTIVRLKRIVVVLVVTALVFSVLGLIRGNFIGGRFVRISTMFDANDVAFVEICLLPFALFVLLGSFKAFAKLLALISIVLGVLLALYTGSRGGMIGLITFLVLFLFSVRSVPKSRKIILVLVLTAAAVVNASKINVDRYMTLTNLEGDYNSTSETGRKGVWKRGLTILANNPITGVGVLRFAEAIGAERREDNLTGRWQSSHNSYLQVLAETGLLGGTAFLLLMVTCAKTFMRLGRTAGSAPGTELNVLCPVLLTGFVAQLLTAFFIAQGYSVFFTLPFAMAASLRRIAAASDTPASIPTS